ncbi:MAG TPA: YicC/YloC family endoribonuclease [Pyrinomonadaceae bacterium]|nr:YicC/YloC family endoribonuclease [Pyrinomonadaceae bacterium]
MKSMTGFGRGSATGENFSVAVDLKTVNNRFLDVHLRLGAELSSLEAIVKRRIGARLSRGRVDANIVFERTGEVAYELNRPLIAGYITALRAMQQEFEIVGEPDINVFARLPGAMQPVRDGIDERMIEGVERAIDEALDELEQMRLREGKELGAEMHSRLDEIARHVPTIEAAAGALVDAYRTRLQKRITDLVARNDQQGIELDPSRLAQEVAYLADRSDISEEIARLKSHLSQFREALDMEGETGKRLDFLLQELNREANTVLSKSTEMVIKEAALAIKAEVEKLREQVQNVE